MDTSDIFVALFYACCFALGHFIGKGWARKRKEGRL